MYVPDLVSGLPELPAGITGGDTFGLGDIHTTLFFSPAKPGMAIWGVGPSITIPTATDDLLGTRKWSAGPSASVLFMPKPWVFGALVRQLVSFAGNSDRKDVSQLLIEPFLRTTIFRAAGTWCHLQASPPIGRPLVAKSGMCPLEAGADGSLKSASCQSTRQFRHFSMWNTRRMVQTGRLKFNSSFCYQSDGST